MAAAVGTAAGQGSRPVKDDVGFCWDPANMRRFIEFLAASEPATAQAAPEAPALAAILPHDDYLYAGRVAYPFVRSFAAREVLIFGVTHAAVRREIGDPRGVIILDRHATWRGVGRDVRIAPLREALVDGLDSDDVLVSDRAHELEHSIEALVPYLQQNRPDVRITPVMVTAMPFERMQSLASRVGSILRQYCSHSGLVAGRDLVILISSDANHYGADFSNTPFGEDSLAHARGVALDRSIIRRHLEGPLTVERIVSLSKALWTEAGEERVVWCGKYSIPFGLLVAEQCSPTVLQGTLLRYGDTYSGGVLPLTQTGMGTTAPFSLKHWVGFFSMEFR
jgi:AmmeMemoRadiSam system protein B